MHDLKFGNQCSTPLSSNKRKGEENGLQFRCSHRGRPPKLGLAEGSQTIQLGHLMVDQLVISASSLSVTGLSHKGNHQTDIEAGPEIDRVPMRHVRWDGKPKEMSSNLSKSTPTQVVGACGWW